MKAMYKIIFWFLGIAMTGQDLKYLEKYELLFDKAHTYFRKNLILTTVFDTKHWWLPFPVAQVSLYTGFQQNLGW